jgi:hypothetical protein
MRKSTALLLTLCLLLSGVVATLPVAPAYALGGYIDPDG